MKHSKIKGLMARLEGGKRKGHRKASRKTGRKHGRK